MSSTIFLFLGRFVNEFFKIGFEQMQMFDLNEPVIVDNVEVTAIDANQLVVHSFRFKSIS